ncbi:MAG: hypothetical protein NZ585_14465 [Chloracidobacterium sp.]|nr:hypothetical protein [Chloracidobacterium sp.]MDW8216717.1 hypothetical protein [Acidobacteriota bacterium]
MLRSLLIDSLRRATASAKWALLLTAVNLTLTLVALLPVVLWLNTVNGASLFGERLLRASLDIEWLLAALRIGKSAFPLRLLVTTGLALLLGWLIAAFLAGGVIASFVPQETPRTFQADCRRYFLPLLVAGAATLLLQAGAGFLLAVVWVALYGELTRDQTTPFRAELMQWVGAAAFLLVMWSIRLIADYIKLALVVHGPRRSLLGQLRAGFGVLARHPVASVGFYVWTTWLWLIAVGGLVWLIGQVSPLTWVSSALLFLLSQAVVFVRHWVGLVFVAGGCRLLEAMP